ncbi:MAG: methylmalonyl-CoA epimerase [Deltaproteobacteria bacterium]|nr:methylmalonyl-CoA epimerase [Deltaproteobacteria bacterium]
MTRIDHIGIAVQKLDPAVEFFRDRLGLQLKEVKELPDRGLKIAFFQVGEVLVELLAPLSEDSQIGKFLATRGEGIHHMALSTDDINGKMADLTAAGIRMATPTTSIGAEGFPIAFLHPKATHGVLLELIEKK